MGAQAHEHMNRLGLELASIAPGLLSEPGTRSGQDDGAPPPEALRREALRALARCQTQQSKWTRYQLIKELGAMLPPEIRRLAPERMLPLLEDLADRVLASEFEPVVCLEAPELVDV